MKRFAPIIQLCLLMFIFFSCERETFMLTVQTSGTSQVFQAQIENLGDTLTKVYADSQMRVLWNADDRISVFNKRAYNQEYKFMGENGDNAGNFEAVGTIGEGNGLPSIYAVYPYAFEMSIDGNGLISLFLPAEQTYLANSFGKGANTMVSVTEDNMLRFKNAGGYLSFKFYGEGVSVKSITLMGNNHEKLAGKAAITMSAGDTPTVVMQNDATESITLVCDEPIALNALAENYTEFWFVIPPTTFTKGFTVTVTDILGRVFTQSTSQLVTISRNNLSRMAAMEVVPKYQYVPFADANFKAYCVQRFDKDGDGEISMAEASIIEVISVSTADIESLQGIEFMPNLKSLYCVGTGAYYSPNNPDYFNSSGKLTELDVSKNTKLVNLDCSCNYIRSLDVSNNLALIYLDCSRNKMFHLEIGEKSVIEYLRYGYTYLKNVIDPSSFITLIQLNCSYAGIQNLDVTGMKNLMSLDCGGNQLRSLDVSQNTALQSLSCYSNQLTSLNVCSNTALTYFSCGQNQLTSLDVSHNASLQTLYCNNNQLTLLGFGHNTALTILNCDNNQLTSLNVSQNSALADLSCANNASNLVISIRGGQIFKNFNHDNYVSIVETGDPIPQGDITFVDSNFKSYCVNNFDLNKDDEISYAEALLITVVHCLNQKITTLAGIEFFTNLREIECSQNQLTSLDVSHNTALTRLLCNRNRLTSLDVSYNTALTHLSCYSNRLTSLDICNNTALTLLNFDNNQLSILDVSQNTALRDLYCNNNQLTSLSVNNNIALMYLECKNNQLTSLDVSHNAALGHLYCNNNLNLTEIWLKTNQSILNFDYDPDITTIKYKE